MWIVGEYCMSIETFSDESCQHQSQCMESYLIEEGHNLIPNSNLTLTLDLVLTRPNLKKQH